MNSHLSHGLLKPRGLYAPESRQRTSEPILCADRIGVVRVAAGSTQKVLSVAVFFLAIATYGTLPARISGIITYWTNTVLQSLTIDPCQYEAVEPTCDSFTKCFASSVLQQESCRFQSGYTAQA